ncbi:MAG: DUF3019 domain-containing protein [Pseudomonadales bacterium]
MRSKCVLYFASLVTVATLQAQAIEQPIGSIAANPKLCIVRTEGEWCTIDVELAWQSNTDQHYCIRKSEQEAVLHCWPSARLGEFLDRVKAKKDTAYQLVWLSDGVEHALDEDTLNVVHVVPEDRRRARRRKHIWSVF